MDSGLISPYLALIGEMEKVIGNGLNGFKKRVNPAKKSNKGEEGDANY